MTTHVVYMYLYTSGETDVVATVRITEAGDLYKQARDFVYLMVT